MAEPQAPSNANSHCQNTDNKDLLFQKDEILVINVLGGPGVGKGTQCERLAKEFGISHLSVGDLLREEKNRPGSASSNLIEQTLQQGTLVPAELAVTVLKKAMLQETRKGTKIFLVDGFPRNMDQALHFESTICKSRVTLFFDGSREVMLERVLDRGTYSQRIDDNEEAFEKRWQGFNSDTMPVIEYFSTKDKVVTINCNGPLETGYFDVKRVVEEIRSSYKCDHRPYNPYVDDYGGTMLLEAIS